MASMLRDLAREGARNLKLQTAMAAGLLKDGLHKAGADKLRSYKDEVIYHVRRPPIAASTHTPQRSQCTRERPRVLRGCAVSTSSPEVLSAGGAGYAAMRRLRKRGCGSCLQERDTLLQVVKALAAFRDSAHALHDSHSKELKVMHMYAPASAHHPLR